MSDQYYDKFQGMFGVPGKGKNVITKQNTLIAKSEWDLFISELKKLINNLNNDKNYFKNIPDIPTDMIENKILRTYECATIFNMCMFNLSYNPLIDNEQYVLNCNIEEEGEKKNETAYKVSIEVYKT